MSRTRRVSAEEFAMIKRRLPRKDQIIMDVIRQTGLRIGDVLSLPELTHCKLKVTEQKTGKEREVHIEARTLAECKKLRMSKDGRQFDIDASTFYRHIKGACASLGIKNVSAHSIRKLYAFEYYQKYGLRRTRAELQHDHIETTMLYVFKMTEDEDE